MIAGSGGAVGELRCVDCLDGSDEEDAAEGPSAAGLSVDEEAIVVGVDVAGGSATGAPAKTGAPPRRACVGRRATARRGEIERLCQY